MKLVFASGNPGKLREIARIFAALDIDVLPQSRFAIESPPETGTTFTANALLKARHAVAVTGLAAMADDSGIVVDALDGRPGVYSARYAGPDASDAANLEKLLDEMRDVPDKRRGAAFHCAAVLVFPEADQAPLIAEGTWSGRITRSRRGSGGFGYDPVFLDTRLGKTGAELSGQEKDAVSHRGKAFRTLCELLEDHLRSS